MLFTACELGVFDALDPAPRGAAWVWRALRLSPRGTRLLLDACAALGLLRVEDDGADGDVRGGAGPPGDRGGDVRSGAGSEGGRRGRNVRDARVTSWRAGPEHSEELRSWWACPGS